MRNITVAMGDGIGPEIMDATLKILKEAGAQIVIETIDIGQKQYEMGHSTGIPPKAWGSIHKNKIILKAPITTPQGGGYKSLNVTLRKALGLYANIRPCISYPPFIDTYQPNLNMVIVRENEEDLYTGIEYRHTQNMFQALKLISKTGCERIIRYAFDYACSNNRKKVTCVTKDNIMKFCDGTFHKVFDEVAKEYPEIENNHMIVDIASAKIAAKPELFDVVVTLNLYGDVISDIAAEVSGSVGLAGSSNIGKEYAMFEAIHGSAPDIAGQNIANPSGLLNGAIMMLLHIGQCDVAAKIQNAWLKTIEDGHHTADIYNANNGSKEKLGTKEFADMVIKNLGQKPKVFDIVDYNQDNNKKISSKEVCIANIEKEEKQLVGVDIYIDWQGNDASILAGKVQECVAEANLKLQLISVKGFKVWPSDNTQIDSDHWNCRFVPEGVPKLTKHEDIAAILGCLASKNIDFVHVENLYSFNDKLGFTVAQGD